MNPPFRGITPYAKPGTVQTTFKDPVNNQTSYTYDPYGRPVTQTDPAIGTNPAGVWATSYDRAGNPIQTITPTGATTKATFDGLGRQLTATQVERATTVATTNLPLRSYTSTNTYDQAGNLVAQKTPEGKTSTATFNTAGQMITAIDPMGNTSTVAYDLSGHVTSVTDPDGIQQSTLYDLAGRPTANTVTNAGTTLTYTTTFDAMGRPLTVTSPGGHTTDQQWDALGQLIKVTEHPTLTTTTAVQYAYDAAGNRTKYTDGNNNVTTTTYSPWNQVEKVTEPATTQTPTDRVFTSKYNILGQMASSLAPGGISRTNSYNALGNLVGQTGAGATGTTTARSFVFDAAGQMTSFSAVGGTQAMTLYDSGQLKTLTGPAGNATYIYNGDGTINQETGPAGTATYTYNAANRLTTATDPITGNTLTFGYTPVGMPTGYTSKTSTNATGPSITNTYDAVNRLAGITVKNPAGATTLAQSFGYDPDSNLTTKTELGQTSTYTYDGAERLISWAVTAGATTNYTYDKNGNRLTAGAANYTYNQRNQLVSDSTGANYTYSPSGQLTGTTTAAPNATKYDAFDQMITDGNTTYAYDALGRTGTRTTTTPAATQTFKYADLGNQAAQFGPSLVNYLPNGNPVSTLRNTGFAELVLTNQHGDVNATFSASTGAQVTKKVYDPWGAVTSTNGTGPQPIIGYQGGFTDPTTTKVNAASRWYTPGTGSFTTRDTATINAPPTAATNRYTYGAANPLKYTDTTGHNPAVLICLFLCPEVILGGITLGVATTNPWGGGTTTIPGSASADPAAQAQAAQAKAAAQYLAQQQLNAMYARWAADAAAAAKAKNDAYNAAKAAANAAAVPGSYPTTPRGGGTPTCTTCYADDRGGNPWPPYIPGDEPGPGGSGGTNDTGGRGGRGGGGGGGGGGGTTYPDPNIAKIIAAMVHVATNLATEIDWGIPGDLQPTVTDRPNTVRADTDLVITSSNPAGTPNQTQTASTCSTTCEQATSPTSAAGGGPTGPPTGGGPPTLTATPDPDDEGVDIENANFAQKWYSQKFSGKGLFGGRTVSDIANQLRSGALSPKDIPINVVVRDGNTLITNTRSAQALIKAGVPRTSWNVVNQTGNPLFEGLLTDQLVRNGLTSSGYVFP